MTAPRIAIFDTTLRDGETGSRMFYAHRREGPHGTAIGVAWGRCDRGGVSIASEGDFAAVRAVRRSVRV